MQKAMLFAFFMSFLASSKAGGWTDWNDIDELMITECSSNTDKGFKIEFKAVHDNPDNCSSSLILDVPCDHIKFDSVIAMSLSAFAMKQKLNAYVSSCNSEGHAIVKAIKLR